MIRSRVRLPILFGLIGLLLVVTAVASMAQHALPRNSLDKIDPWILTTTASGEQAEFLIVLAKQADLSGAANLPTKIEKGRFVYKALYETAQTAQAPLIDWLQARGVEYRPYYIVDLIWVKADRNVALDLAARSDVARLEGNPQVRLLPEPAAMIGPIETGAPNGVEPGINYVHAPQVWAMGYTGQGIVIGGQDTGIQWDHPALKNHYRGWNTTTLTVTHDYNWHDSIHTGGSSCGADSPFPCDDYGHGTHTMGTAVGDDGGANQIGMAPGAKFIGCRNMNDGVGSPASYLECFEFFLAPYPVTGTPAQGNSDLAPDVTNNSWGCPFGAPPAGEGCVPDSLLAAVQAQRAAGIMTVASAGNSGSSCSTVSDPPSYHAEVYTVGALNTGTDSIASFSSRGPVTADGSGRRKPDISAPGTNIRSSVPGSTYESGWSGTSMASPHVAGAVALLWSARPLLKNNIDLTVQILDDSAAHINSSTCDTAGTTWPNNTYGYGRLDVKAAVDLAPSTDSTLHGKVTNAVNSNPIAGAAITATASLTKTGTTTADASGMYTLPLISGTYTVDVVAYGYQAAQIAGVNLISGTTTTLNITLTPSTFYTVTGAVKDALTGLPLTATIAITGYPGSPIATDASGHYTVSLVADSGYVFKATANAPGYATVTRAVGPLTNDRVEDFDLAPDMVACVAPGYTLIGVSESFSSGLTPTNWIVSSTVPSVGWRFDNPGGRANYTGGTGGMAIGDSDYFGSGQNLNSELRTPSMNLSALTTVTLRFKTDFNYFAGGSAEVADVDVSVDGGSSWTNAWRKTASYRGPVELDLSAPAAGQAAVQIRFHYYNAIYDGWWQVDDVQLGYCAPPNFSRPDLSPSAASLSGLPGSTVAYDLQMANLSNDTNAYTVTTQADWPTVLSTDVITMTPHAAATLLVSVTIPFTATGGQSDVATIDMTGSNGTATTRLTTTARWPYAIYLPLVVSQ